MKVSKLFPTSLEAVCLLCQKLHYLIANIASIRTEDYAARTPHWELTPVHNMFTRRVFKSLPQKEDLILLIEKAFQGFNSAFPIFDKEDFMQRLEAPDSSFQDASWWACVNVMLALALRFKALGSANKDSEDRDAWGYFQNALAVATELTTLHTSLSAVQALLGMAVVVQGTPNPGPYVSLAAAAFRLAQSMDFHRNDQDPALGTAEIEQRKRVFWILYFIDKEISLTTGKPPVQDDDDMDVEMPDDLITAYGCTPYQPFGLNERRFFRHRVELALIQGQIYKRLITVTSLRKTAVERMVIVDDLAKSLRAWKGRVPLRSPACPFESKSREIPDIAPTLHCIILRLAFFNTLEVLHKISRNSMTTIAKSNGGSRASQETAIQYAALRVEEARCALQLLGVTPQGDYACIW
jgi:hypothetical protein